MRDFVESLGKEIQRANLSARALASGAELPASTVQNWFTRGSRPNVMDAVKVAQVLGLTVEDIVGVSPAPRSAARRELDRMLDLLPDSELADLTDLAQGKLFRRARESQTGSGL